MLQDAFADLVDLGVDRQQHVRPLGQEEPPLGVDPRFLEALELAEERLRADHHAVAQQAADAGVQDPGRDQVEGEVAVAEAHRVPGVVTALIAHHAVERGAEEIDDLPLALVPPLQSENDESTHSTSAGQ